MRRRALAAVLACLASAGGARLAAAAPPPPNGPHPRIALSKRVLAALKAQATAPGTGMASAIEECKKAPVTPGAYGGYMGIEWASGASACGLAYQVTGQPEYAARGIVLWRALLEDVGRIGDGAACVMGATAEKATASIRRDTGYAIRFIGLHAALAYDWLHDAPGSSEWLRAQSRACFREWIEWYTSKGYMRDTPGANYHAGFVAAKTLITIAESGEDAPDGASARFWTEVVDDVFGRQMVANGLASSSGGIPMLHQGALVGGDWPEGWQYGPLSVIEYALAARALDEQGVSWPEVSSWMDDLTLRFIYGLAPTRKEMYVGGDTEGPTPYVAASSGPLLATLIGPSSDRAAGFAAHLRRELGLVRYGPTVFDALAEARAVRPADPMKVKRLPWFLARGTRTLYARSAFTPDAFWSVFTSPPRVVPDHQHMDASGFVLSRGADPLIVDPSPYGSRSSLTGNALTVDSDVVQGDYKPSQTPWSRAELPWVRGTASGLVAARAEIEGAFTFGELGSDVPLARRDWVFLPEGELVLVDRAVTGAPGRSMYLRFRTPATLSLAAGALPSARGHVGASDVVIHTVSAQPAAAPVVRVVPKSEECQGSFGACAAARFPVNEYALKLTGPEVLAMHVIDGLPRDAAPAEVAAFANGDVVGVAVVRASKEVLVIEAAAPRALLPESLSYEVSGRQPARHVVFDAPDRGIGRTAVDAVALPDGRCRLRLSTSGAVLVAARPAVFLLGPAAGGCKVTEDAEVVATGGADPPLPSVDPQSKLRGGCGCALSTCATGGGPHARRAVAAVSALLVLGALWSARRRGRRPRG